MDIFANDIMINAGVLNKLKGHLPIVDIQTSDDIVALLWSTIANVFLKFYHDIRGLVFNKQVSETRKDYKI